MTTPTNSRERILSTLKKNLPSPKALPSLDEYTNNATTGDHVARFMEVLKNIGGAVIEAPDLPTIAAYVQEQYVGKRVVSMVPQLSQLTTHSIDKDPHFLANVELAIFPTHFAVAENGACWITDDLLGDRALPFITQHIALIVHRNTIVPTMHAAYQRIGAATQQFGTFIAGPSKTADIEQSLVLGAHGPKSMTVFVI